MVTPNPKAIRKLMELAVDVMRKSVPERRKDGKQSPRVGAVLRMTDGTAVSGCRSELREGDHAEFTVLERKCRDRRLDGALLFSTLEPCAPGSRRHPKLGCAERIVDARIGEVWVGIEDPDPAVDRKGMRYLEDCGVVVHMFDPDLQVQIRAENDAFLKQALDRAETARRRPAAQPPSLSTLEGRARNTTMNDLRPCTLKKYMGRLGLRGNPDSTEFRRILERQGLVVKEGRTLTPTGFGLLLFGDRPRDTYPQAGLVATVRYPDGTEDLRSFDGPLVEVPKDVEDWLKRMLPSSIDRSQMVRIEREALPFEVVREVVVNALLHRDYEVAGAKCQIVVTPDAITVRSPGGPVSPITLAQLQAFNAPTLSRNPRVHYVLRLMGLAEEAGFGMATLRSARAKYTLPAPQYSFDDPYLVLTIFRSAESAARALAGTAFDGLNPDERRGWLFLATRSSTTKPEYARRMGFEPRKAQRHLSRFLSLRLVRRTGSARATKYEVVHR